MFAHSLVALGLLLLAAVIFVPALIIGSVGAHRLVTTRQEQLVYTSTVCFVSNVTEESLSFDCNCDGCHPSTCYAEHFYVQYQIENGTTLSSIIHVDEIPQLLQIQANNNYTCYYDRTQVNNVQWVVPSERPALALLIAGFSVAGAVIVAVVIGQIRWFVKERLALKNTHDRF